MSDKKRIELISLGCPKNQVDLEYLIGDLEAREYEFTDNTGDADAVVINTCGFLQSAVEEAIDTILESKKHMKESSKLIVTGCMVERYKEALLDEIPEIDFVAGVGNLHSVGTAIVDSSSKSHITDEKSFEFSGKRGLTTNNFAYLKIAEGCDKLCTYCIIPKLRGKFRSRSVEDIVQEFIWLVKSGVKEIILISQDTGAYGNDIGTDMPYLLSRLCKLDGDFKIRLMYMNPEEITDKLLRVMSQNDKVVKYLDLPVQHGSDLILRRMNRKHTSAELLDLIQKIRSNVPGIVLRTSIIVGFPGEDQQQFDNLLDFVKEARFDHAGFFNYSDEEESVSYKLQPKVAPDIIEERIAIIRELQDSISNEIFSTLNTPQYAFVDSTVTGAEFLLNARAMFQAPDIDGSLYLSSEEPIEGSGPHPFKIVKTEYPDIYGEIIGVSDE